MAHEHILDVDDSSFDAILRSRVPVVVDFWAGWCGPCRVIAPMLEALAETHAGKVRVAKVDVDVASTTARTYGIRSIPTLLLFHKGEVVQQQVGADKRDLERLFDKASAL